MLRRWLLVAIITVTAGIGSAVAWSVVQTRPALMEISSRGPLVVVGVPTLTWADTPDTRGSELWGLARRGAVGALATRNLSQHSCFLDSWLTLSAGARTALFVTGGPSPPPQAPGTCLPAPTPVVTGRTAVFSDWPEWRRITLNRTQPAEIGRLGAVLSRGGQCIGAAGLFASLGAADTDGFVSDYTADPRQVDLTACPVTFISLAGPDDTYLRWLTHQLPATATIVVAGLADDTGPETLHSVVIAGPGVRHGLLTSDSTKQRGVITTTDLSAFLFQRLGPRAPQLPEGRPPLVQPSGSPTAPVVRTTEITHALTLEHDFVPVFLPLFFALVVAGWAIGALAWLPVRGRDPASAVRRGIRRWFAFVSAGAAAMPVSTFVVNLAPWWRGDRPLLQLTAGVLGLSFVFGVLALVGPWRRLPGGSAAFLALLTATVIGLDVSHGSDLQFLSMLGLQPVYGSRFSGMGNVAFALFATSSLLVAAIVSSPLMRRGRLGRLLAVVTVMLIGAVTVLVDGYPGWGADGGGTTALVPAFAYLTIRATGLHLTPVRMLVVAAGTAVVVGSLAVWDYLRGPADRTHLGDYVAQLRGGNPMVGLNRIWQANWNFLSSSPLTWCVPLILLLIVAVTARPHSRLARPLWPVIRAVPFLGPGLGAIAVVWLLGFLFNDSGTAVPPSGAMLLVPLLALTAAQVAASAAAQHGTASTQPTGEPTVIGVGS